MPAYHGGEHQSPREQLLSVRDFLHFVLVCHAVRCGREVDARQARRCGGGRTFALQHEEGHHGRVHEQKGRLVFERAELQHPEVVVDALVVQPLRSEDKVTEEKLQRATSPPDRQRVRCLQVE